MVPLTLPSKQFEIFSREKILTEHSNLRRWFSVGEWPKEFYLESEKTGARKLYRHSVSEYSKDNELEAMVYVNPDDPWLPSVTIFND